MATTYKIKQWKYTNYNGKVATTKKNLTNVYFFNKGNFELLTTFATLNAIIGVTSGRAVEMTNGITYYLVTLKNAFNGNEYGYVTLQDFYFLTPKPTDEEKAKDDAQKMFNLLVANDKKLMTQILKRQLLLLNLKAKGINVAEDERKLKEIAEAFQRRQLAIKTNPALSIVNYFKISGIGIGCPGKTNCSCNKNHDGQVGFIPLLIPVAIGAGIVLAGFVMYYFLKPEYNTSQLHSEYLTSNEAVLKAKLGPAEYEALKQNVDKEIKEAAQTAYDEGKSETTWGTIKNVGLMAAGVFLFMKIQGSSNASKK